MPRVLGAGHAHGQLARMSGGQGMNVGQRVGRERIFGESQNLMIRRGKMGL